MDVLKDETKLNEKNFAIMSELLGIFKEIIEFKIKK